MLRLEDALFNGLLNTQPSRMCIHLKHLEEALDGEDFQGISDPHIQSRVARAKLLARELRELILSPASAEKAVNLEHMKYRLIAEEPEIVNCILAFTA